MLFGGHAKIRHRTAFATTDFFEHTQTLLGYGQHVALLRLVAPDRHGRHRWVGSRDRAKLKTAAYPAVMQKFRDGIGQPTRADVMDRRDGVALAQHPALVDDFLGASLHLGVGALHRGIVKLL